MKRTRWIAVIALLVAVLRSPGHAEAKLPTRSNNNNNNSADDKNNNHDNNNNLLSDELHFKDDEDVNRDGEEIEIENNNNSVDYVFQQQQQKSAAHDGPVTSPAVVVVVVASDASAPDENEPSSRSTSATETSKTTKTSYAHAYTNSNNNNNSNNGTAEINNNTPSYKNNYNNKNDDVHSVQPQLRRPSFANPFGQLGSWFGGSDQLQAFQDFGLLFQAERHTIFRLHTAATSEREPSDDVGDDQADDKRNDKRGESDVMRDDRGDGKSINRRAGVRAGMRPVMGVDVSAAPTADPSPATNATATATAPASSGRVLHVVSDTIGAAFGVTKDSGVATHTERVELYDAASLRRSRFNPFNPTRILIHGWFGGSHAGVYGTLVPAYLRLSGGLNVFTVDWGRGALADYITASYRVKPVGRTVAKFIDFLHRESGCRLQDIHVVGFSMGAHVAGIAGKFLQSGRLPVIYALDPALPLFRYERPAERVDVADADYVEVVHTSVGSYGYDRPLGHVDFYVNFGSAQPGCFFNECSHFRAFQVFAEALSASSRSSSPSPSPSSSQSPPLVGFGCDPLLWQDIVKRRRCLRPTGRNLTLGGGGGGGAGDVDAEQLRQRRGVFCLTTSAGAAKRATGIVGKF